MCGSSTVLGHRTPTHGRVLRELLARTIGAIGALDEAAMRAAGARQLHLTKPPGSLGRLEEVVRQIAGITRSSVPRLLRRAIILIAADHGVTEERVSAYQPRPRSAPLQGLITAASAEFAGRKAGWTDTQVRTLCGLLRRESTGALATLSPVPRRRGPRSC